MNGGRFSLRKLMLAAPMLLLMVAIGAPGAALTKDAPLLTKEELKAALGSPNLVIIDVRAPKDWKGSNEKIKGAVREEPDQVKVWAKKYAPTQQQVVYCA